MEQPSGSDPVSELGRRLGDEDFRNAFAKDPSQALSDKGIDEQALPDRLVDTLSGCDPEELAALAKVRSGLESAGVDKKYWSQIV